jgi:hypothetical protein
MYDRGADVAVLEPDVRASTPHQNRYPHKEAPMDGSQFDVWTRRRFGLAAGGLSASLLTLASLEDAEAKKRKKRKKKKRVSASISARNVVR